MTELSFILGVTVRILLDVELAAMMLRMVAEIIAKRTSPIRRMLFFVTEPAVYAVRTLSSRKNLFSKAPIDVPLLISFVAIASLNALFRIWF